MYSPDQEAQLINKPGHREDVWDPDAFGGGKNKRECIEAMAADKELRDR